jgi:hypothetical protein
MSEDLRQLRAVLRQAIGASRLSARHIETAVGLGHGNLERILDGRSDVRIRHLLALAKLLQIPPQDFLELGIPQPEAGTRYRLKDWIMPPAFSPPNSEPTADAPVADLGKLVRDAVQEALSTDLKDAIRAVVRDEMDGKTPKTKR